jgi:hypothetical protein
MQKCSGAEQLIKKVERVGFEQFSIFNRCPFRKIIKSRDQKAG